MQDPGQKQASRLCADYANGSDFCRALQYEMGRLYVLAFLLSTNHEQAERCMVQTVQEIPEHQTVFREWVRIWIRHALIKNAIRSVLPGPRPVAQARDRWWDHQSEPAETATIEAITRLSALDRFVFVLSVLERYSFKECSVLLDCSVETVMEARMRAFEALGSRASILAADAGSTSGYLAASA
jgi:DNA-directed RNA polymerase specialized sigma24 family protein